MVRFKKAKGPFLYKTGLLTACKSAWSSTSEMSVRSHNGFFCYNAHILVMEWTWKYQAIFSDTYTSKMLTLIYSFNLDAAFKEYFSNIWYFLKGQICTKHVIYNSLCSLFMLWASSCGCHTIYIIHSFLFLPTQTWRITRAW